MAGGGVNNGLFQRVFLESGAATGLTPIPKSDYAPRQQQYNSIVEKSGELSLRIPTFANFTDDKSILGFTGSFLSYTPVPTLQALLDLFSPSDYADTGPPGSGHLWSRVVDVDNYVQSFCPVFTAANQIAAKDRWDALHSGSKVPAFYGVSQGADLPFLYSPQPLQGTRVDVKLGYAFQSYVISFVNHGDPNFNRMPGGPPAWQWSKYSTQNPAEIVFSQHEEDTSQPMIFMEADPTDHVKCAYVEAHNVDFLR
ncbi:hypothetical protein LOCC1_G000437 [Lachnellula occidentalis]|uniref:Uncharacterized protein n=1 Tax=Lachnellula occidentalis TaxID=215460 RepID=A0A8H8SBU7_9HELO|nr:hypothetical protein LOCC1_G000437 [Lachnellula occidentalis]